MSTGDELVSGPGPLAPGQIRDSNRPSLLALVAESGCVGIDLGSVADDGVRHRGRAGERGGRVRRHPHERRRQHGRLRLREGRPRPHQRRHDVDADRHQAGEAIGVRDRRGACPVFGLPGNPVSSMVSFELFARPALRTMMGHAAIDRPRLAAIADDGFRAPARRQDALRAGRRRASASDGRCHVRSSGGQGSHQLAAMAAANALAVLPDGDGGRGRRHRGSRGSSASTGSLVRMADAAHRHVRPRPPRPAHLGDRPVQLPVRLLHARGGHEVAAPGRAAHVRGDRAGGAGLRRALRRRQHPPHRRRAHRAGPPAGADRRSWPGSASTSPSPPTAPRSASSPTTWPPPACGASTSRATRSGPTASRRSPAATRCPRCSTASTRRSRPGCRP